VGLDGLRAVAVLAVVLYHADLGWIPGGFLGVDVFFVLSGFLITSLLLVELERTGRVQFRRFYLRRARRLLPALLAVLAATAVLVATVAYDAAPSYRRDLPGALLYYSNWLNIVTETSYFEFIGRPPMLKHLWSLAVEEQFYIVWPAIAWLAYRWRGARAVGLVALGGALTATVAMVVGSVAGRMPAPGDPSRLYFGTDTHAMGILLGAALAVVWRPGRTSPVLPRGPRIVITLAGTAALAGLVWMFLRVGEYSVFLYRGGFLVVAAISAVAVAAASHRGVAFGRWVGLPPLRWIGERSYGIYLWHWPLFLVTRPGVDIPVDGWAALTLRLVLLLVVAEASYRYLEMPIRRHGFSGAWRWVRSWRVPGPRWVPAVAMALALVAVAGTGYRVAVAPSAGAVALAATPERLAALPPARHPLERDFARWADAEGRDLRPKATAFGDSVMLGASGALENGALNVDIHAQVATQAGRLLEVVRAQVRAGAVRNRAILHLGSNGIVNSQQLRAMLVALGDRRIVLVNSRVPRPWMKPNNAVMAEVAADYPNVTIADWASAAAGRRDYFVADGVHLTPKGARAYAALIARAAGVP
jgi:peptidoglycan/LPS O-acetylase OafA/YrhL